MSKHNEKALQDPANWDFDHAEERIPEKTPARAVVSVSFAREDYGKVVGAARNAGKKTSEFIREVVLAHIESPNTISSVRWGGHGVILATPVLDSLTVRAATKSEWTKVPSLP